MAEWLASGLGFLSAILVGLIAAGFAAMFAFFSGSALLVLGQFLPFVTWRSALVAGVGAVAVMAGAGMALIEGPFWWVLAFWQALLTPLFFGLVRWRSSHRMLVRGFGALLLVCGALFLLSLVVPSLAESGRWAALVGEGLLEIVALGAWPLVLGGLVGISVLALLTTWAGAPRPDVTTLCARITTLCVARSSTCTSTHSLGSLESV